MTEPERTASSPVAGRRIVLGVTGGIAAYKAIDVCRRLVDAGAHVVPVMTEGAEHFVGRTTLSALASEPVQSSLWDERDPIPHTRLGQGADLIVVVPATARLIGAYAAGISSDLLTATLAGDQGAGGRVPGDAHRDVGAPGGRGEPGDAAPARRRGGGARGRPPGRWRHRQGPSGQPRARSWPRSSAASALAISRASPWW